MSQVELRFVGAWIPILDSFVAIAHNGLPVLEMSHFAENGSFPGRLHRATLRLRLNTS
jgi:hypothetical protein